MKYIYVHFNCTLANICLIDSFDLFLAYMIFFFA